MEHTTFTNAQVKELLSTEYYFVSFNGEDSRQLSYNNETFSYQPHSSQSGTNDLARDLGEIEGQLVFPTLLVMSPSQEIVARYGSFLSSKELLGILKRITI